MSINGIGYDLRLTDAVDNEDIYLAARSSGAVRLGIGGSASLFELTATGLTVDIPITANNGISGTINSGNALNFGTSAGDGNIVATIGEFSNNSLAVNAYNGNALLIAQSRVNAMGLYAGGEYGSTPPFMIGTVGTAALIFSDSVAGDTLLNAPTGSTFRFGFGATGASLVQLTSNKLTVADAVQLFALEASISNLSVGTLYDPSSNSVASLSGGAIQEARVVNLLDGNGTLTIGLLSGEATFPGTATFNNGLSVVAGSITLGGTPITHSATAPTGSGSTKEWCLSDDGKISFCNGTTWTQVAP